MRVFVNVLQLVHRRKCSSNRITRTSLHDGLVGNQPAVRVLGKDRDTIAWLDTKLLHRPATTNLNASIHYLSPSDKYEVTLGGTNLTDDRYLTVGSVNGVQGETVGTYNPPRQWYLQLKTRLGE